MMVEVSSPARAGGVQSLERAFAILETIAAHSDGISLAELSKAVGLHNSTAFHLVKTMVGLGYVRQNATNKRYHIGSKVFGLAASSRREIDLIAVANPVIEEIARRTGESAHVALYAGEEIVVAARTQGSGAFQLQERHGGLRPGHATAIGKVLLAFLPPQRLKAYLDQHELRPLTGRTITDPARLTEELERIRKTGIAYDDCEFDEEVRCMAMPVRDFTGKVVAAIGLSGPVWRLSLQSLQEKRSVLEEAAHRLSAELGGEGAGLRAAS